MTRQHLINGEVIPFTTAEETARNTQESEEATKQAQEGYKTARRDSYPSIANQLDMQYWDKKNGTTTWVDAISKVKSDNPKS
tara:strand:+ start:688 stop:933 length:246 start_codon:yes stop_codon:yes gene_type:complete